MSRRLLIFVQLFSCQVDNIYDVLYGVDLLENPRRDSVNTSSDLNMSNDQGKTHSDGLLPVWNSACVYWSTLPIINIKYWPIYIYIYI